MISVPKTGSTVEELSACAFGEKRNMGDTLMALLMQLVGLRALDYDPEIFNTFTNQAIGLFGVYVVYTSERVDKYEQFLNK